MQIRPFLPSDIDEVLELFYETFHAINSKDYSPEQVNAVAPKNLDRALWLKNLTTRFTLVAEQNGILMGFIDFKNDGELDHLYVHKAFQRQGIATALLENVIAEARRLNFKKITAESSITAKPFFEKHGFTVIATNQKERRGQFFKTYLMEKAVLPKNSK